MGYQVRIGEEHFVKRTARFGFVRLGAIPGRSQPLKEQLEPTGRVVLTTDRLEAKAWTRKRDAVRAAQALIFHRTLNDTVYKKKPIPQGQVIIDLEKRPNE